DDFDPVRLTPVAPITRDREEFVAEDAVMQPGTAVSAIHAVPESGESAHPARGDRSAPAMALQIYALQQRFGNRADAPRGTVSASASPAADRPQQVWPPTDA